MKRVLFIVVGLILGAPVVGQESFRVELGRDDDTIEDMRPVFLTFETRPLPAISPAEVARRYQQLFEVSDEPEVRIDALNRLGNIRDRSGESIGFSPEQEVAVYQQALDSYESILAHGSFTGRLDELLYQMAKAHALTGESEKSINRLKQLVGLYPKSPLVAEAYFRIAESAFASAEYAVAETSYLDAINTAHSSNAGHSAGMAEKARYMLGWSQFKQGQAAWDRAGKTFCQVLQERIPNTSVLESVRDTDADTIDDTLRMLAVMAARQKGGDSLIAWLGGKSELKASHGETGSRRWAYLAFDRLADYYAAQGHFEKSVEVNRLFVAIAPDHPRKADFMAQIAAVWQLAGDLPKARQAKADYVEMFGSDAGYSSLKMAEQARWQVLSRELADYFYYRGTEQKQQDIAGYQVSFQKAGTYYFGLARRQAQSGEVWRLAGDAFLQAGNAANALDSFRTAAYDIPDYPEAADSGWAAVAVLRDHYESDLESVTAESDRFAMAFHDDPRLPGLMVFVARRWREQGLPEVAMAYAGKVLLLEHSTTPERYAAWVLIGNVRQETGEYVLAEEAWTHALQLMEAETWPELPEGAEQQVRRQLAGAIYQQAEHANATGKPILAVGHFHRVEAAMPGSEIAIKARFDAANTLLQAAEYSDAIPELISFRKAFPDHPLAGRIKDKLVFAYTSSGQALSAANELLAGIDLERDPWSIRLRAAALFHEAGDKTRRNELYLSYLKTGPEADSAAKHLELQTLRNRLIASMDDPGRLRQEMVAQEMASPWHSQETLAWSARQSLVMGARAAAVFSSVQLMQPLAASLDRKQSALESARQHFLDAESLGGEAVRSESLYRRAELYRTLARDLMASSVPEELNELEGMQYQMLLEEEAFPFEEKAIGLHSDNHRRIAEEGYDPWIGKSMAVLARLNPGRYDRSVRWMSWTKEDDDDAS